jgi:hypothetical protein
MDATVKCSSCGAEITKLTVSYGKWQWIWGLVMIPFLLLSLVPSWWSLYGPKESFHQSLVVTEAEKIVEGSNCSILGKIENHGKTEWKGILMNAEFFDSKGTFIHELSWQINTSVAPGGMDHFKLTMKNVSAAIQNKDTRMEVKVVGASHKSRYE